MVVAHGDQKADTGKLTLYHMTNDSATEMGEFKPIKKV